MYRFIFRRLISAGFVLWGVSFLTFMLMAFAPGDPAAKVAYARYGGADNVTGTTIEWIRQHEGLDRPWLAQYANWLKHIVKLDFGNSMITRTKVTEIIMNRLPNTLQLALAAGGFCLAISLPLGLISGIKKGSWIDTLGVGLSVLGVSIPNFWLGLVLIIVFAVELQWLPAFGRDSWRHLILPAFTLGSGITAYSTRILRSSTAQALQSEFLLSIRAKGVGEGRIIGFHVAKNVMIPMITILALEIGYLLEGAVITETIFAWPGVGQLMFTAVSDNDYPLIQGLVILAAFCFITINFTVDVLYKWLDPRINL
ncbi:ABC transporter permease [Desulfocicer niacini]